MKKIKIAQIGTSDNSHGNDIFKCLLRNDDVFEVVGYCLPENEREKFPNRMADFEGYPELTLDEILNNPEIEAVTVETEEIYLTKYATMAAKHGKHMHMEKPGGVELADFENLIGLMKKSGKTFHTGYMYRYNPYIMELKEQIKNGEFGDIISVEAQMNCNHPKSVRQWLENFPGGMMFFLGCHLVDLVLSIKGIPKNVIPYNRCSGIEGVNAEDMGMAIFEYDSGISFAKTFATELGGFERRQLVVSGTKKTVEINPLEWGDYPKWFTTRRTRESTSWAVGGIVEKSEIYDRYDTMIRSFGKMVRGEMENPFGCDYELELYKTVLKACGKEI